MLKNYKLMFALWLLGMLGVLSILPVIPQLISSSKVPIAFPMPVMLALTALQSGVLVLIAVVLGSVFSQKTNLSAPVMTAFINKQSMLEQLKPQLLPALLGGILGGLFIVIFALKMQPLLPPEFLLAAKNLSIPWYARIFYGGIVEELLIRWGLMSFWVWLFFRVFQGGKSDIKPIVYCAAIVVSAFVFGLGHLPTAYALSSVVNAPLLAYILIGNGVFGLVAGGLYWKYGLECAMLSHMLAHMTMVVLELVLVV